MSQVNGPVFLLFCCSVDGFALISVQHQIVLAIKLPSVPHIKHGIKNAVRCNSDHATKQPC